MIICQFTYPARKYHLYNTANGKETKTPREEYHHIYYTDKILKELFNYLITGELSPELEYIKEQLT